MTNANAYPKGSRRGEQTVLMTHNGLGNLKAGDVYDETAFTPRELDEVKQRYRIQFGHVQQVGPFLGRGLVRIIGPREGGR